MKIDRNLVNVTFEEKKLQEFIKYIENEMNFEKTKFQNFFSSTISFTIAFFLLLLAFLTLIFGTMFWEWKMAFFVITVFFLFLSAIWLFLIKLTKEKVFKLILQKINFETISKKWFHFFGVNENDVFSTETNHELINEYRKSPNDAKIISESPTICLRTKSILTTFTTINWHWERIYEDKNGEEKKKNYYLLQTYIIDYNLSKKWDNFTFYLEQKKSLLRKKHKSLENDKFNSLFNYNYNDEVKIRMLFTPSVQESFVKNFVWKSVEIQKKHDYVLTTCLNKRINKNFAPLTFKTHFFKFSEKRLKKRISSYLTQNYQHLTMFLGHTRIMYPLYEK